MLCLFCKKRTDMLNLYPEERSVMQNLYPKERTDMLCYAYSVKRELICWICTLRRDMLCRTCILRREMICYTILCLLSKERTESFKAPGGGVLPYLGMVGRFRGDDPRFWEFRSDWVPILYLSTIWLTPSFWRKIGLSLSHLVPEILGPKFGLFFHQNVLFNRF